MKAILLRPEQPAEIIDIDPTPQAIQALVGVKVRGVDVSRYV